MALVMPLLEVSFRSWSLAKTCWSAVELAISLLMWSFSVLVAHSLRSQQASHGHNFLPCLRPSPALVFCHGSGGSGWIVNVASYYLFRVFLSCVQYKSDSVSVSTLRIGSLAALLLEGRTPTAEIFVAFELISC